VKEEITIDLQTLIFLAFSLKFHALLFRARGTRFVLLLVVYILCTWLLFSGSVALHEYLRSKGIHFEFGHAEEELGEIFLLWLILLILNIIIVIGRRSFASPNSVRRKE
jgi:hypothetical protein